MSVKLITRSIWNNPGNRGRRLRKSFAAVGWQIWKRTVRTPRVLKLPNGVQFKAYPDCVVSSALIYAAWPEFHELQFLRRQLRSGDVVLDVGANVGHLSLLLADVVGSQNIFAFEPTPVTFRRLQENWKLNCWPADGLFQMAVGAQAGQIFVPDTEKPDTKNQVAATPRNGRTVPVPLTALDDLRGHWRERKVGLLKIDVEGYEREVFCGSRQLLAQDRPRLIMFESLAGSVEPEITALLRDANYVVFQLDANGRPDFAGASAQNLFALPAERRNEISRD